MPDKKNIILVHGLFKPDFFDRFNKSEGRNIFLLEGRPNLQSVKQSSAALLKRKIKPTVIADNMAGFLFYKKMVKEIWLSYQAVDQEGALCSVGGLILGVLGCRHKAPVYLHPSNKTLPMLGKPKDICFFNGVRVAPGNIPGYVPLLDWVPKKYIRKIYGK